MRLKHETRAIGDLCDFTNGRGFKAKEWASSGWPIIRIQNLNGSEEFNYYDGETEQAWFVEPGQLLFAWAGTRGVSFGPAMWSGPKGVLNQHIYKVHPKTGVDVRWLNDALQIATARIERKAHGFKSTLVHVHKSDITEQVVYVPSLQERQRIVNVLDRWNRAISLTECLIAANLEQRKGLMQQLLSGKRRFPEFSEPWHDVSLRQITTESKSRNKEGYGRKSVRAVTNSAGMIPMRAQTIAENLDRYKVVEPNGFAYNPMRINVGSICMWDGTVPVLVSPDYVVFSCNEGELDPDFFNYLRQTHHWDFYMSVAGNGSVRVRIYYADLAALHFKIPPYREQKKISAVLRTADREIALLRDQLSALKEQKKGLMQQLLTGKKRVKVTEEAA